MKVSPLNRLSGKYLAALRADSGQAPQAGLRAAQEIGREAVAAGLETLDLARIHHQALSQLLLRDDSAVTREALTARAAAFFTEAITPINDEIAQSLLAVHMRILALKNEVAANHTHLARKIAATRSLVDASAKTLSRLAHEFSIQRER